MEVKLTVLLLTLVAGILSVHGGDIALGKPTWQSSNEYGYTGQSSLAVDGNTDPKFGDGSCSHTGLEVSPWWAVDLGQTTIVKVVTIFNRADMCGFRLHNFIVGLSDVSPDVATPSPSNYRICALYPGAVGEADSAQITCTDSSVGRYLIIQIPGQLPSFLSLCEVIVNNDFNN